MSQPHVVVDGYTISGLIGRGGSSSVYRGHQDAFDRDVAIKVLEVDPRDEDARRRFIRECAAAGRVSAHPNIVTILDSGVTSDGRPYLTTELCPGGSLAERSRADGPMSVAEVLRIGVKLSGALATAHAAGILHRDVKPDNVLTTAFGEPALTDFGISTVGEQAPSTTTRGSYTLHHAPPETLSGGQITAAADIYGLCSTLHHLLAGHPPFGAETSVPLATIVQRVMHESPPPIGRSDIPAAVLTILATGMAKEASARYPSAEALGTALRSAQHGIGEAPTEMVVLGAAAGSPLAPPAASPVSAASSLATAPPPDGTVVRRPIAAGALPDPAATPDHAAPSTGIDTPLPAPPPPPPPPSAPSNAPSVVTSDSTVVGGVHALATPLPDAPTEIENSGTKRRQVLLVLIALLLVIGAGAYFAVRSSNDPSATTADGATTTAGQFATSSALSSTTLTSDASSTVASSPNASVLAAGASAPGSTTITAAASTVATTATATPTTRSTATTRSGSGSATTAANPTSATTASTAPTTAATTAATTTVAPTTTAPHLAVTSISASPSTAPCGPSPTTEVTLTWKTTLAASVTIGIENPQPFEQGLPANGSFTVPFTGCSNGNDKVTYYVVAKGFNGVDATTSTIVVNAAV